VLGGPDPEGEGRVGESLLSALEKASVPMAETAVRAAEAARRLLLAAESAGSATPKKVIGALAPETAVPGLLGALAFEPPGGIRFFPHRLWRVRNGRFEEWPPGALPTPDCGPPLGFGDVWTLPAENGAPRNLTHSDDAADRMPVWSPDGESIAFISDRSGEYEVWLAPSDGDGAPRQLTNGHKAYFANLQWSPDGKRLSTADQLGGRDRSRTRDRRRDDSQRLKQYRISTFQFLRASISDQHADILFSGQSIKRLFVLLVDWGANSTQFIV
jgi:WD40 repeat protein